MAEPASSPLPTAPGDAVIEFRDISYSIPPNKEVLNQLKLTVHRGDTMVLLGRSGSGKTTALKLINHLLVPTGGELLVEGKPTTQWDVIGLRRRIGYVIQEGGLFPHYTIAENVGIAPRLLGQNPEQVRARIDEMLRLVDLEPGDFRERYPHQLSGGQRQRAGVARALAGDPPILLMDEPFGALDPMSRAEIQRQFKALQQRLGKTIVLVTHDLREALYLGSQIALLEAGSLVGRFRKTEFLNSSDERVRKYISAFDTSDDVIALSPSSEHPSAGAPG